MNDTPDPDMATRTSTPRVSTEPSDVQTMSAHVRVPSDATAPGTARQLVREVAAGLDHALIERAELAVSELVTNAVRHGSDAGSPIDLAVERDGVRLVVTVGDAGRPGLTEVDDAGGFGIDIVSQISDELTIAADRGWTVTAVFSPRPSQPSPDGS